MANYRAIKGLEIQVQSSDPSDPPKGRVWYNTTAGTIKVAGAGGWSSGGLINTARAGLGSANVGTNTAGLNMGGDTPTHVQSEEYDGTTWTIVNNMSTTQTAGGSCGTQTAAAYYGGYSPIPSGPPTTKTDITQEYDGTSWTSVNTLNTNRTDAGGGGGTQTSAMFYGGWMPPSTNVTESYDGTSWTNEPNFNQAASTDRGGCGTIPAFVIWGGNIGSASTATEEFDATSWTTVNSLGVGRINSRGFGIQTAAISAGNNPSGPNVVVESYDGTSWAVASALSTGRYQAAASGTTTSGMTFGGSPSTATTEEWSDPAITTITTST